MALAAAEAAKSAYLAGVAAADPTRLVKARVRTGALDDWFEDRMAPRPIHVLALGKAAARMVWGLVEANVPFTGIGAAPQGISLPQLEGFRWHRGEHPVPGPGSFDAGHAILQWVDALPPDAHVLALVSGGGSACAEAADADEAQLVAEWNAWLREGLPVETMNGLRAARSRLKGGRLAARLLDRGAAVRAWVLSDTADGARSVASGPLWHDGVHHEVLADAQTAVAGAAQALSADGVAPFAFPRRITSLDDLPAFLEMAEGLERGEALVGAGEIALAVPPDAPPGGRCQHAALAAAGWLQRRGSDRVLLAAATDGIDGTTREAGAWAVRDDADRRALAAWRAHSHLDRLGRTLRTGPSGTNVNDLWISVHAGFAAQRDATAGDGA